MKKLIFLSLMSCLTLGMFSCTKEKEKRLKSTYEVITSNGSNWYGAYTGDKGAGITISENESLPSGTKIDIEPKYSPFVMGLSAYSKMPVNDFNYPEITINFYVNDILRETITKTPTKEIPYISLDFVF